MALSKSACARCAVAGGLVVAAARPPRIDVGWVGLDGFGIGGDRLVAFPGVVGFLAALQCRQGLFLVGLGVCRGGGKKQAAQGQQQGESRQMRS